MTLFKLLLLLLFLMIITSVVNNFGNQALSQTLGGMNIGFTFLEGFVAWCIQILKECVAFLSQYNDN